MKPSDIHSKKLSRYTRRRLMKTLSAAGISSAMLGLLNADTVRGAASDEIPIAVDTKGESETYVDAGWYDRLVKAREVSNELKNGFLPEQASSQAKMATKRIRDSVTGVWLDAGSGNSEPHVIVSIAEESEARGDAPGAIPERKQGIPIEVEFAEREEELTNCIPEGRSDTSETPGGLAVKFDKDSSNTGTLTSRAWDDDDFSDAKLMTAAHVPENAAGGSCGDQLLGMEAKNNGDIIGEVDYIDHENDIAVIEPTNTNPLDEVWNPGDHSQTYDVTGTMSKDGVDNLVNNGDKVKKCGIKSCLTEGNVSARGKKERALVNENCTKYWRDCVRWGSYDSIGAGDSGSIAFAEDPNASGYLATNINSWRWLDYSAGPAGYAIDNTHNYYWG